MTVNTVPSISVITLTNTLALGDAAWSHSHPARAAELKASWYRQP